MTSPEEITVSLSKGENTAPCGAGWLLPGGRILTCAHVVEAEETMYVRHKAGDPVRYRVKQILEIAVTSGPCPAYDGDLALLVADGDSQAIEPGKNYLPGFPRQGEAAIGYGFPADSPNGRTGFGEVGAATAAGRREIIADTRPGKQLTQGFSGGPVLAQGSRMVIGLFASTRREAERGNVIPVHQIKAWLEGLGEETSFVDPGEEWPTRRINDIRTTIFGTMIPGEEFDLRIRRYDPATVTGVGSTRGDPVYQKQDLDPLALVTEASRSGAQVLIYGNGGSGKSSFLIQFAEALERASRDFVWLNLKQLKPLAQAEEASGDPFARLDAGWQEVMEWIAARASATFLPDGFPRSDAPVVIIADGLNEVGKDAPRLLAALERFVTLSRQASLVATSRTTTRLAPTRPSSCYEMRPFSDDEIARITRQSLAALDERYVHMLATPQTLAIAIKTGSFDKLSRTAIFDHYFRLAIGKVLEGTGSEGRREGEILDALSAYSFKTLCGAGVTLAINEAVWREGLGKALAGEDAGLQVGPLVDGLVDQGLLIRSEEADGTRTISWQHSLYVEWLAARHFAALHPSEWTNVGFTAISLEDSSEDGLRLAIEMVHPEFMDAFLLYMYDWRWQRVVNVLVDEIPGLPDDLRDALIGLNALRLLDSFRHTQEAIEVPLRRMADAGDGFAQQLLDAAATRSETGLLDAVRQRFLGRTFARDDLGSLAGWQALLELQPPADGIAIRMLVVADPFVGWAASNIIRLIGLTPAAVEALFIAYIASHSTSAGPPGEDQGDRFEFNAGVGLRWRIVHVMGGAIPPDALDSVISGLVPIWQEDLEHRDVRFGACRSLMEIALKHPDKRATIFGSMKGTLASWREEKHPDPMWLASAHKAAEQLWRAWKPAEGMLDEAGLTAWTGSLREVLEEAKETGGVLGWRLEPLERALAELRDQEGKVDGG